MKLLKQPPGALAFQRVVQLPSGIRVFIKVQLFNGKAFGRSFHISTQE
jgi:hypothetical protein